MYRDRSQQALSTQPRYTPGFLIQVWFKRNLVWLVLTGLVLLSLILVLMQ
jgi:hypothetical protein